MTDPHPPQPAPTETEIETLLEDLAPEGPGPRFYQRIEIQPWMQKQQPAGAHSPQRPRLASWLVTSAVVVWLIIFAVAATPQGQALAQNLFRFFQPAGGDSFPIPTEMVVVNTPSPEEPTAPPPPTAVVPACAGLTGRARLDCLLPIAASQFGSIKAPLGDIPGLTFGDMQYSTEIVTIQFEAVSGGSALILTQSRTPFDQPPWDLIPPQAAVEGVTVGGYEGEYVMGMFVVKPESTEAVWEPSAPSRRLRWQEGDTLFELRLMGHTASVEYLEKDTLLALAESLIYQPQPSESQTFATIAEAEAASGFDLLEPASLPEGFVLDSVEYNPGNRYVVVTYEYGGQDGVAGIVIFQRPAEGTLEGAGASRPPEAVAQVDVNGYPALYVTGAWEVPSSDSLPEGAPTPAPVWHGDAGNQGVMWIQAGMEYALHFFPSESYTGPPLTQDDMIALAESLK